MKDYRPDTPTEECPGRAIVQKLQRILNEFPDSADRENEHALDMLFEGIEYAITDYESNIK